MNLFVETVFHSKKKQQITISNVDLTVSTLLIFFYDREDVIIMIRRMNEVFRPDPSGDPIVSIGSFRDILNDYYGQLVSIARKDYALRDDANSIQAGDTLSKATEI